MHDFAEPFDIADDARGLISEDNGTLLRHDLIRVHLVLKVKISIKQY